MSWVTAVWRQRPLLYIPASQVLLQPLHAAAVRALRALASLRPCYAFLKLSVFLCWRQESVMMYIRFSTGLPKYRVCNSAGLTWHRMFAIDFPTFSVSDMIFSLVPLQMRDCDQRPVPEYPLSRDSLRSRCMVNDVHILAETS